MGDLTRNFSKREFACHCKDKGFTAPEFCGGKSVYNHELVAVLQKLVDDYSTFGKSAMCRINSGYRCPAYNATLEGSAAKSKHMEGIAADIVVFFDGRQLHPSAIADYLEARYPDSCGIGRYKTFTHFDVRSGKARWNNA